MIAAARKAGRALIRDFGELENLQISMKGPADFVTSADKRTEKILIEELSKARPGYGFLGEEGGAIDGADKTHRFIIDPIDGTTNFMHGIPHFAISIGLEREGQLVAGVVYNPVTDDLFTAEKGHGAYLNNKRLRVAARKELAPSVIATGLPFLGKEGHARASCRNGCGDECDRGHPPLRLGLAGPGLCRGRPLRRLLGAFPAGLGHRGGHRAGARGRRHGHRPARRR